MRVESPARNGFTLVEVLAVLIIVAILAGVGTPIYLSYVKGARAADAQTTIGSIVTAEKIYKQKFDKFAPIDMLKQKQVLTIDPATETNWQFEVVFTQDVISKVTATSLDGMPGGAGHMVNYDPTKGEFSGYGQDKE